MAKTRPMPPLRAVFLDVGDTIMRPSPSWEHVYAMAFDEFGIEVTVEDLQRALRAAYRHGGWGLEAGFEPTEEATFRRAMEMDQVALSELGIGPMPEAFFRRLSELFMVTSHWHVFPDVYPTLQELRRRGLVIATLSNWVWNLPELLHALDLVRRFDFITASARVGFEKPHPRIFEWALERAGVSSAEAMHVGDHPEADVQGALRAGMSAVLIDRFDRRSRDDVPAGVPIIRSLDELVPLVDTRLAGAVA
jgi:putative hydrolase of the HAD superfamily